MADNQGTRSSQGSQQIQKMSEAKGAIKISSHYSPKDLKPYLDAIQRVVCLLLAVWVMIHYNNLWEFIAILAVSQIDPRGAKDILVRVLKGFVSEGR